MIVNINHFSQHLVSRDMIHITAFINLLYTFIVSGTMSLHLKITASSLVHFCSILFSAGLTEQIKLDRYLHPHFRYYMREVRTVVYSQFLESYKSVTIEAMAKAFGVTVEFIDL